jgi:WD40 repeat protein/formylglycine-generating enzyme required for sulfatase activity/serine/threonine protein kinase
MSNSKNRNAEHNLIFAGLGLQLGIIAKDKVIRAFTEWLFDKTRPLGEILVHQKAITPEQRKTLESAVEAHIQQEGGEQKALASLNHVKDLESDLDHLADNDLNQTLDGAVTQRKLLGLDVLFSQSHDSESSSTNKKGSFSGPESKQTDRFERQHFLDSGNLGEVFFAKDTELNRTVVTKYIRPEMSGDTFKQALFHLEGEVTGALEHPSVVPVYGLGKDTKGRIYYAMRYIRGKKLSRVIAEYHCKEAGLKQEALTGLLQNFQAVCLAIEYAHSKGVLHCDIKPDNIMIGDYGEVFVVDWGLVVVCGDVKSPSEIHQMETLDPGIIPPYKPSELASSGLHEQQGGSRRGVGGTPAYMAPEQFTATMSEDISLVTPKADIYALGSTLYHILTGKAPHLPKEGIKESPDAFYFRITTGMIPTPREKDASIPKLLEQIVLKAMQVEPGDRYASARELAEDIKRYVSDEPVHAYQESGLEKARRWVRKNRALVGAAMVMLLLVTVGAMGLLFVEVKHSRELLVSKNETAEKNLELKASNKDAIDAKEKAEKETDRADKETKKALLQQDRAESWRYFSKFNRAITDLEGGLTKNGLKELASTPFPYRGWEHDFITSNFYGKYATLTSDSNGIFCYSPDGKKIAGGSDDGSIKIWDAETGKEVHNLSSHSDDSRVTSISYSPDGKKVASGSDDYSIKIWDAETGKELQTLTGHTENIYSVSFSPDGKRLLSSSGDSDGDDKNTDANHLKMWDLNTGKELAILNKQKGSVYAANFSSDGKKIASGESDDYSIKIWDAETGKELQTLKGHTSWVYCLSFSPDGKKIASGSDDYSIKIWDAETGKELQTLTGHTSSVTSVSFSPDGKKIASGGWDISIKIWDAKTGKEVQTLKGHTSSVTSVSFSHNGKTITSGGSDGIKIWNVVNSDELQTLEEPDSRVTSISYSPDGKKVASGSDDYSIKIWDAETGKELQTLTGHTEEITSVSFSPDGKRLLSSSGDSDGDDKNTDANHLKMWDLNTGKELAILNKQKGSVYAATFSSDGKKIASGSWDNSIKIWDAETGKELQTLKGHTSFVTSVSFSPDGKKIASGSWDNSIKIWDAETGKELQTLTGHTEEITSVSFSPNGKKIASGSWDNSIKIWDAETGKELQTLKGYTSFKTSVSFSPDGKRLLSSSGDPDGSVPNETNHLKMWDLSTGNELVGLFNKQKGFVTASTFSPDGKKIVSAGEDGNIKIWTADEKLDKTLLQGGMSNIVGMHVKNNEIVAWNSEGQIKYWDFKTGEKINENNLAFEIKGGCLLDDGKNLIVWDDLFNIWLIDITDEKPKIKINGNEHPITVFFANKKTTKTINKKGDLKTFDIETGREIKPELLGSWNGSNATFSSDGKKIARTSENYDKPANSIIIWDAKTGKKLKTLTGHNSSVTSISFSPDGKKIASGSDDMSIKIWNAETAEELQTLTGHSSRFYSISFSPDGKKIASNANDYSIKIWDAETGKELQTLTGHTEEITSVSFSPDGKKIASGSWDKSIKIWDAETAEELQTLTGHTSFVNSTSFSPDGKKIASGSDYNSIKIWDAETGKEVANLLGSENESFVGFYFTEDSNRVISCDSYGGILIWEINGSGKVKTISKPTPQINCTAFNKNAKFVARGFNDGSIKLLKASDLSEFSAIRIHDSSLIDICYYEDGKLIASGDKKGIIKIWEPESGNVRISIQGDNNPTYSLAFSSDGKTVVQEYVVEEMTKKIAWETATGKKTNLPEEKLKLPLDENKVQLNSSDKKWSLESDYKNVYLVNNELRAKRIASDKAKFAKWTKPDPVWHLDQADESGKSSQFFAEIFHLKQLLKIKPDDKTIQLRLKKCEDSYSRFLEIQKKMELAEAAGFALFAPFSETKAKEVQKKVAKNLKNEEKTDLGKGINLEMMLIPAGKFKMGSPKSELGRRPDETQHEVTLTKPYYMGKYEVTQEQWEVVMGNKPSSTKEVKLPVTKVSWEDCQEFIKKLNAKTNGGYRLPTEAEWEFACRAGTTAAYSVGDNLTKGDASINGDSTKAVGSYKPNAFGLYDMHGNVWEWCEDWKADYPAGAVIDPKGAATGEYRILRGGRFGFGPSDSRSANRDNYGVTPDSSFADGGFRLARSINSKDLLETDIKELFLKEIKEQEEKAKKEQEEKAKKEAEAKLKKEAEDAKVKEAQKKAAMILNKEVEVKTELEKGINLEMVLIPAGKFIMGSPVSEKNHRKDETEHEVTLTKPFYMGKYEVTQEQYEAMMGNNPSKIKGAKLPVTEVSWLDCQEFIKKLNAKTNGGYRLPTEAEWEYACRAGTTTAYSFGDSITKDEANVAWGTSTKMVGSYKPNAFGLYDMHGNVWEWCEDWKADYPKESVIDPKGPATGQYRLLRGGSFTGAGSHSRAANWWGTLPATKENDYLGLRLARTP